MAFNATNLLLSMAILKDSKLPQDKKLAASVGAAMAPGILGLALPMIIARNSAGDGPTPPGTSPGSGIPEEQTPDTPLQTMVPNVQDKTEAAAVDTIKRAGLSPLVSRAYFKPSDEVQVPPVGQVVSQDPKPSAEWIDVGSKVRLEVSLGAPPAEAGASEHDLHTALETEIKTRMDDMDEKVDLILSEVGRFNSDTQAKH